MNPSFKSAPLLGIVLDFLVKALLFQQPAWCLCQGDHVLEVDKKDDKRQNDPD